MPKNKATGCIDPFQNDPKFFWDYKYVFNITAINPENKILLENFFNDISNSPTLPKNPKKWTTLCKT